MKTRLTDLLGIDYPIIQGAMAWVSFAPLVAAVSNAGGLGIVGGTIFDAAQMREEIRKVKALTPKPFGVNVLARSPLVDELLDIIIEEGVTVTTYGTGNPKRIIDRLKGSGVLAMPVVPSVATAVRAEADGAAAVIVSGTEGGGHVGQMSSMALIPQAADRLTIPFAAAGGFADGRGLAAALVLGAHGIQMGTRFICTQETPVHMNAKQAIIAAQAEGTLVTGNITGMPVRALKNKMTIEFAAIENEKKDPIEAALFGAGKMYKAFVEGDVVDGSVMAGQISGMISDIPTVQELIDRMIRSANDALHSAVSSLAAR